MKRLVLAFYMSLFAAFILGWLFVAAGGPVSAGGWSEAPRSPRAVPGYVPEPFPDTTKATMPTVGLDGSGAGYCVTIEGTDLRVNVPMHVLDPVKRDQLNRKNANAIGFEPLSTDPGIIVQEYRISVQNAFKLLAHMSGDERLKAASEKPLRFVDLGDAPTVEGAGDTTCMRSTCYGKAPGSGCRPKGCSGGCADCVSIRVPSMQ